MATIKETTNKLSVSSQTVRNYIKKYPDSFSPAAKRKHDKQFDKKDWDVIELIKQNRYADIQTKLPIRPQEMETPDLDPEPQTQFPVLTDQQMAITALNSAHKKTIDTLSDDLERTQQREDKAVRELDDLRNNYFNIRKPGKKK